MTPLKFITLAIVALFAVVKGASVPFKERQLSEDGPGKHLCLCVRFACYCTLCTTALERTAASNAALDLRECLEPVSNHVCWLAMLHRARC
jgi:hypothetical protein